jgi:hypothetical protein
MKKINCMLLAVMALVGCSEFDQISNGDESRVPVRLYGVINDTGITRGDGVIEQNLTSDLSLDLFRADMDPGLAYGSTYMKKLGGVMDADGKIALTPTQYYLPNVAQKTKYIAVYPAGGVYNENDRTVTYVLDGTMDVMCSNTVESHKGITTFPTLTLDHLLTRLEVLVKADNNGGAELTDIIDSWGKVKSIKVKGRKTGVVLTLPAPTATAGEVGMLAAADTGSTADLELKNKDGSTIATEGIEIPGNGTSTTFGYALFLPTAGSGEKLTLEIETENSGGAVTINTAANVKYLAATVYKITVLFNLNDATLNVEMSAGSGGTGTWGDGSAENIDIIDL